MLTKKKTVGWQQRWLLWASQKHKRAMQMQTHVSIWASWGALWWWWMVWHEAATVKEKCRDKKWPDTDFSTGCGQPSLIQHAWTVSSPMLSHLQNTILCFVLAEIVFFIEISAFMLKYVVKLCQIWCTLLIDVMISGRLLYCLWRHWVRTKTYVQKLARATSKCIERKLLFLPLTWLFRLWGNLFY